MRADLEDLLIRLRIKIVHTTRDMTPYFKELVKTFVICSLGVGFAMSLMMIVVGMIKFTNSTETYPQRENYGCDKN
jgi:hypothetical protein